MKIVFLDSTLNSSLIGGAQTFLAEIVKELARRGHQLHLVYSGHPNKKIRDLISSSGAELYDKVWSRRVLPSRAGRKLAGWLNELNPDVYIVSVSPDIGWLCLPYLNPSIKTVAIAHSNLLAFYEPARHYKDFLTAVIGVSHEICSRFETFSNISPENIKWIPYGVRSLAREFEIKPGEGPLRLIFVGRLDEGQKRISDLVSILLELDRQGIPFTCKIIGDGPCMEMVQHKLGSLISSGLVVLTGWLDNAAILQHLLDSEIFLLTSSQEGFSIALTEALANGCCPLVTDIPSGSVQLIQHGLNGFLFSVGDINGFVGQISILHNDRQQIPRLRKEALRTGQQFSIESMVNNYEQFFRGLIKNDFGKERKAQPDFPLLPSCVSKYPSWVRSIRAFFWPR